MEAQTQKSGFAKPHTFSLDPEDTVAPTPRALTGGGRDALLSKVQISQSNRTDWPYSIGITFRSITLRAYTN